MNMGKVVTPRQTNLNISPASLRDMDDKEVKVIKPQLVSRPVKKSADDTRTELGKLRLRNLDESSGEESESVIVKVSEEAGSAETSDSDSLSSTERVAAKRVEAKTQDGNDDVLRPVDIYCSEPNLKARCTLSVLATSASTVLGVLFVMTLKGDESISYQATWIGVAALSGLALSSAAGLIHFVHSNIGKPPQTAVITQPA